MNDVTHNVPPLAGAGLKPEAKPGATGRRPRRPLMNPYLAAFGLGLVLLASFLVMGRGLGATAASGSVVAWLSGLVAPAWTAANPALKGYYADPPWINWTVYLMIGAFVGALVSAWLGRRIRARIERGPHLSVNARLALAFGGGAISAMGAKLAKGCTSGQALTGGAQLNLGSWVFMLAVFAGAYLLAWFVRKEWQ
ncbi:MAG: YeeE/YedE thiosulfate transporter family protein [Betaproteobacteria bacterium]|jgi:uncharacterized membrane protein YedE/YeeE